MLFSPESMLLEADKLVVTLHRRHDEYSKRANMLQEEFGAAGDPLGRERDGWERELQPKGKGL